MFLLVWVVLLSVCGVSVCDSVNICISCHASVYVSAWVSACVYVYVYSGCECIFIRAS